MSPLQSPVFPFLGLHVLSWSPWRLLGIQVWASCLALGSETLPAAPGSFLGSDGDFWLLWTKGVEKIRGQGKKRVWGGGSELWLVELGGCWLNHGRFKSWLCHLLVVWPCVSMGPPRSQHCSEKQCARTSLGEVLVWMKSDCVVNLPVSEGEKEREKCLEVSTLCSLRKFGASKWLSEEPVFSRNEPALVSLLYPTLMGCDGFQIQQVHSHGHHTT